MIQVRNMQKLLIMVTMKMYLDDEAVSFCVKQKSTNEIFNTALISGRSWFKSDDINPKSLEDTDLHYRLLTIIRQKTVQLQFQLILQISNLPSQESKLTN